MGQFDLRQALWVAHSCGRLGVPFSQTALWISSPVGGILALETVLQALDLWFKVRHDEADVIRVIGDGLIAYTDGKPIVVPAL